eukprot:8149758-Karenia_brevis.AAC.1
MQVLKEILHVPSPSIKENLEGLKHEAVQEGNKLQCQFCSQLLNKRQDLEDIKCPGISLYSPVQVNRPWTVPQGTNIQWG